MLHNSEFGPTRIRAFGTDSVTATDPTEFRTEILGANSEFTTCEINFQICDIIMQALTRIIAASGIKVLDMPRNTSDLGKLMANTVAQYGITISELYTKNISLPPCSWSGFGHPHVAQFDR